MLALRCAAVRVLGRNRETERLARQIERDLTRVIETNGSTEGIYRIIARQSPQLRKLINGTARDALREIRAYRRQTARAR